VQKFNFQAVNDEDSNLQSKSGGKFGLNTNCHFATIAYITNAGKDESAGEAVDINIQIGDREHRRRIYNPEGAALYGKDNVQLNPGAEGYQQVLNEALAQNTAMIIHAVKATGVSQENINLALNTKNPQTFGEFAQVLVSLLPLNYKEREIDVFLQYQWNISEGQDRTFLELPKNMKDKYWVVPSTPGAVWKEIRDDNGLIYVDTNGNKHKIYKTKAFLESPKATQQTLSGNTANPLGETAAAKKDKSAW
jgi:archaellum component FlaG (FlaF/FlaG flagellin family)